MRISPDDFIQGETYRTRKREGLGKLKGAQFNGLRLEPVLANDICSYITADVGGNVSRTRLAFRFAKGFLGHVRRNWLLRDLAKQATLEIDIHSCPGLDRQVWVLNEPGQRLTVESQFLNILGDSRYVSLEVALDQPVKASQLFGRISQYLKLFFKCYQRFQGAPFGWNHNLVMQAIWASDIANRARELFPKQKPQALFAHRDFIGRTTSALIQVAQAHDIPTYSTQHSIQPEFTGKNERLGNAVFENTCSDVYVCWGEFSRAQMLKSVVKQSRRQRMLVYGRPTSSDEQQFDIDKTSREKIQIEELIISLMGRRHEEDNAGLLHLVSKLTKHKKWRVTVRAHPALQTDKYKAYVEYIKEQNGVDIELTTARTSVQSEYTEHCLGITGLTSTYYENLFFGIPVVFYDHNIEMVDQLPRVLPGVTSPEELAEQVNLIESTSWLEWYKKADRVCESVYNRKCLDFQPRESMIEFIRADAERRLLSKETA